MFLLFNPRCLVDASRHSNLVKVLPFTFYCLTDASSDRNLVKVCVKMGFSDDKHSGTSTEGPIVYPTVEREDQHARDAERFGTFTMGTPSKPEDHPHNKQAATWESPPPHIPSDEDYESDHGPQSGSGSAGHGDPPAVGTVNPYINTSPAPSYTGKSPMNIIQDYLNKWRPKFEEAAKKAEETAGNMWQHLKTGENMADTAWGRLNQGRKLITEGSFDKIFRQTFDTTSDEQLRKTYACYLSTSSGPVAGTLYISTRKIAFCSDRPLSYKPTPEQTDWSYYKVMVDLKRFQSVKEASNSENDSEKYIQILTIDGYEFWFMGFVNYDKAIRNLQAAQAECS
ncbi:hypothetical protein KP509_15G029100 [Ceratopteris richardii]|uniref:GRAM domain-containing protein n=1 Tax=Ceratopteris richardii TaxID=49495 RepID=A0A8T2T5Q8_CERRI|nr:hypothetical protein KP509_15G029100 [Ceratopteris richardii]